MPTKRAPRRSTEQVTALIVAAAEKLFAERGYRQTTMRAIAAEAGISLSVLYRHFPGKERLFSTVFVGPFIRTYEDFGETWQTRPDQNPKDETVLGEFVRELHRGLLDHRHTLVTLLAAGENPDTELVEEVRSTMGEALGNLQAIAPRVAGDSPEHARDSNILVVAMICGLVLFRPWIAAVREGDEDELLELAATVTLDWMRT